MKIFSYSILASAALMMASCAGNEPENVNGAQGTEGEISYIALSVNLPVADATRAESFEAGETQEYAVVNGKILVFQDAASESAATFVCSADLKGMNWSNPANGEITTSSDGVAELTNINLKDAAVKYSAVVVLNYSENFAFPTAGQTFGQWATTAQNAKMEVTVDGKTYLTMTNAPRFKSATADPTTLSALDKSKVASSESAAVAKGSAAEIHVQRAYAKVAVATGAEFNVAGQSYSGDKATIDAWALDVVNTVAFPVQNVTGLLSSYSDIWGKSRFSGAENAKFRRVYWAIDPNYDAAIDNLTKVKAAFNLTSADKLTSKPAYAYCPENTFDINHQLQGQTTRIVFKATYKPAGLSSKTFFTYGTNSKIYSDNELLNEIAAKAKTALGANVVVALGNAATTAGSHSLKAISIKKGSTELSDADRLAVAKSLGAADINTPIINTYLNGVCYYVARIKHFGDVETPWEIGNETYGGNNEKWLGRYGIVRNNVYEVTVSSITKPGTPVIPEIDTNTPDDENNYFINVSVNVLSWAKRAYTVDL